MKFEYVKSSELKRQCSCGVGYGAVITIVHRTSNHNRGCAMKEIIEMIARAIVDEPGVVSVTEVSGVHTSILELKVAKTDIGKAMGEQGCTAGALRTILSAVSANTRKHTVLEIVE
jgi:predicted RNA-binding protein YlqC (UPF0109 family)